MVDNFCYPKYMHIKIQSINKKQLLLKDLFIGTLIYTAILGFLNDHTNIVDAKSFSTIFYAAGVLQILTVIVFMLKDTILLKLKGRHKALIAFCLWLIMFSSKFVFIWVIDIIFKENININGFFGILLVVLAATLINKIAEKSFMALGDKK